MAVQVGNGLGHDVVHRDEGSLRAPGVPYRDGEPLRPGEKRLDQPPGQVGERLVMLTWNEKRVPVEEGPHIEEGEARFVVQDDVGGLVSRNDPAEEAIRQRS